MTRGRIRSTLGYKLGLRPRKLCSPANPVPAEEGRTSAGGVLRRDMKKIQWTLRGKARRNLNFISSGKRQSRRQQQKALSSLKTGSRRENIPTEQRDLRIEDCRLVLRCARTPKAGSRTRTSLLDLPQDIRSKIFDRVIVKSHFKVPASAYRAKLSFSPNQSVVSYAKGVPPVNHQFYDEYVAAVCRHPSCCMIVTIQDMSRAQYVRRKRQLDPLIPSVTLAEFYPGDPVEYNVIVPEVSGPYFRNIQDLRLHCVIDRSDLGPNVPKSNCGTDTTPSIKAALAIRDLLPELRHCDIHVYFTVREIRAANYSLVWIDDCLKPLATLPSVSTAIQVMIPVTDSRDTKDPFRQHMKPWRATPGGSEEADWLHHGHNISQKDLGGVWNCYRCLRDCQPFHRYKRMEEGWTPRQEGNAYFQTMSSRWRDEGSGATVTNILTRVVDPTHPAPPPQPHVHPEMEHLSNMFAGYNALPGNDYVYPQQSSNRGPGQHS
ncbi:hypothetical protein FKW77_003242 [Venturia effusa]|uniref:Uncharacterized protein n=1 Tax=Venturia effusa TaxID=50376 RepID=A0A517LAP3_9PEZI|nr:hypothetical protein FKW77_003242 [Venturia effusa]